MLKMQIFDADYIVTDNKPIVRVFGKTQTGTSSCVFFRGVRPYFYVFGDNEKLIKYLETRKEVTGIKEVEKLYPIGYTGKPKKMLRVFTHIPAEVPMLRDQMLMDAIRKDIDGMFESDVLFKYRFLVDKKLHGMEWIKIDAARAETKTVKCPTFEAKRIKRLDIKTNAPLRYLSFDIESIPTGDGLPDFKKDPIAIISMAFEPEHRGRKTLVLVAKQTAEEDTQSFRTEADMLKRFVEIMNDFDPDVVTGYNVDNFDIPFLLERLDANKISKCIGRSNDKPAFTSKFGATQSSNITGRVVIDPYQIIKNDPWIRLKRYNLDTVSRELLGEEKLAVDFSEMRALWNGTKTDMKRFIDYARKDSELALKLVIKMGMLDKFIEMSKISGLLLQDALGGQSVRVETALLHEFKKRGFVLPMKPDKKEIQRRTIEREKSELKGAFVLEPDKGLHTEGCVLVLDFKSLYPSVIRTFNICPTCLVTKDTPKSLKTIKSPWGTEFVEPDVREGVLPEILKWLLESRVQTKKQMKTATPDEKRALDAKQLALKTMANSFYGYTGYIRARLYVIDVANAITSYGRDLIQRTKKIIEEKYPVKVLYGDTDSIFVKTSITDLDEAEKLGKKISEDVTSQMPGVIELEFEKIYKTFLILTKKRYAGWKYQRSGSDWVNNIETRGIETVRRDWCALVPEIMDKVLNIVLIEGNVTKAIEYVRSIIQDVKDNKVPIEKMTIIKGITKRPEAYKGIQPHVELVKKMQQRNPADVPMIGSRIGYVIIRGNQMLSKRSEDPDYAKKHKLELDSQYYIENQILPPVGRIVASLGVTKSELVGNGKQVSIHDIMRGGPKATKATTKKEEAQKEAPQADLGDWEEFVCKRCKKSFKRMPLSGRCECGGELLIGFQGSMADRIKTK